jgi:hypothetical protein
MPHSSWWSRILGAPDYKLRNYKSAKPRHLPSLECSGSSVLLGDIWQMPGQLKTTSFKKHGVGKLTHTKGVSSGQEASKQYVLLQPLNHRLKTEISPKLYKVTC